MRPRRYSSIHSTASDAFSLVELVIVIVIIGVISAVAVPRLSSASKNAVSAALTASLTNVRKAADVYYAEHGSYPGYTPSSTSPNGVMFVEQLTLYSDARGNTSAIPSGTHIYGPYLRPPFPKNPINNLDTVTVIASPGDPTPAPGSAGWVAVLSHGYFGLLASGTDIAKFAADLGSSEKFVAGFN